MRSSPAYPKRLIEVDLPIKRISAHARREKSIRHGHISTLHIWWARRPLAACRAVICAALWPDPAGELCPQAFRDKAGEEMKRLAAHFAATKTGLEELTVDLQNDLKGSSAAKRKAAEEEAKRRCDEWQAFHKLKRWDDLATRRALLSFIAWGAGWEQSIMPTFLEAARHLTQAAHEALGGASGTRPLVVDPFAGGGAIPLEALRVGADVFASDLNPVAVLLNKVVLEYIPKYGQRLADEVRKWGQWIKEQAEKELAEFYPKDPDGATPIAYLWARTIKCEGPGCGAEVPLVRSLWLAKKGRHSVALRIIPHPKAKRVDFEIIEKAKTADVGNGTVARGSATCPCCGFTTPVASVRVQFKARKGGAADARLFCVVTTRQREQGRAYRLPTECDLQAVARAKKELEKRTENYRGPLSLVPDELSNEQDLFNNSAALYGMASWGDMFSPRQALSLATYTQLVRTGVPGDANSSLGEAAKSLLALTVDKLADLANSLCAWEPIAECPRHLFARQALPFVWDFAEGVPIGDSSGSFDILVDRLAHILEVIGSDWSTGQVQRASATQSPLPDDTADAVVTDPPYYYSVQYAGLSDFFYVWLRRCLIDTHDSLFSLQLTPKDEEIVVASPTQAFADFGKNNRFFESELQRAFIEARRIAKPHACSVIVFAQLQTSAWEAFLRGVIAGGWIVVGSWPIDTEMASRILAARQSVLGSSIHLVCRPRENPDGSIKSEEVGDWRDVLAELPRRIHDWLPRLAEEGVVGADAIFACLGPALEVFSSYSRVEKASGEQVPLREYLEHVWGAVAQEALGMIFAGADASGFEEDSRLTAMWLWTLKTGNGDKGTGNGQDAEEDQSEEDEGNGKKKPKGGYVLEYDAARKIAQGLGAHLEALTSVVVIEGETARLLPVAERTARLFGKDQAEAPAGRRKKDRQLKLGFQEEVERAEADGGWGAKGAPKVGETTLDRVHQAMILFAAARSEALRRFLVEEGVGREGRFWTLAQALSALYPGKSDEKRWVDGVLARKKGLGL